VLKSGLARTSITHVPGLDGLRGLAVIGVLLFHSNGRLRGGYLGVDLFFVLSGFLITSILVEEHRKRGAIDLYAFWIRRARRLMPALLSLMPAVALYARVFAAPKELAPLRGDALATMAYVANWRAILVRRSYWDMFAAPSPLEHTWSLAIEEQFYVVWPLLVWGVLRLARGRTRAVFALSVALALASCVAMTVLYRSGDTTRVYLGTDTRGAAILFGAALATSGLARRVPGDGGRTFARVLGAFGAVAAAGLAAAWLFLDGQSEFLYRGGFWLTELAAVVLVLCCVRLPDGWIARALSIAPLRAMGLVSYGVYLWHWPIYVVLTEERLGIGGARLLAVRLAATLAIATVSYRFLERPIRERGIGRPAIVVPAVVALAVTLILGSTRAGASPREPAPGAVAPASAPSSNGTPPKLYAMDTVPPATELPAGTLRVLVVGDSVALTLGHRMRWAQETANVFVAERAIGDCSILDGVVPTRTLTGTPPGNGDCARNWVTDVEELRPDVTLIVIGGAYFSTAKTEGRWRSVCDRGWHDAYAKRLEDLLRAIAPYSTRAELLLAAYPVGHWQTPALDDKVDCYNGVLRDAAAAAGAGVIDLNGFLCPDRTCVVTSRNEPVRPDGLHFDGLGAEDTARWVVKELRAADGSTTAPASSSP
jgi:peptidoglycan/LPS O-acetylase OafA/YrhL/lysophospholipase L1-like esterase